MGENIRFLLSRYILSNEPYIEGLGKTLITITEVQPSADLRHAKVYISVIGDDELKVIKVLNDFSKTFSRLIAKELSTKYSPKLSFVADQSYNEASKINRIINSNNG